MSNLGSKRRKLPRIKIPKRRKAANAKLEANKEYTLKEAMDLVNSVNVAKYNASVDLHIKLGVDPRKADQALRGTVSLPHGTGKEKRVLVFCTPDKEAEARAAGADHVGLDDYVAKVQGGWTDVDVVIAMPMTMSKVGRLGRILGPRGLMPSPKTGTVTMNIADAIKEVKKGKISFRVDKYGIIHTSVGRVSFTADQLYDNATEILQTLLRMRPSAAKGIYVRSVFIATSNSPSIPIDAKTIR